MNNVQNSIAALPPLIITPLICTGIINWVRFFLCLVAQVLNIVIKDDGYTGHGRDIKTQEEPYIVSVLVNR